MVILIPFLGTILLVIGLYLFKVPRNASIKVAILSFIIGFFGLVFSGALGNVDTGPTPTSELGNWIRTILILNILIFLFIIWRQKSKKQF